MARPLDLPENLELGGAVHLGGFNEGLIHVAQSRHVQHDGLADRGGKQNQDYKPDSGFRVAQPVKASRARHLVKDAIVGVQNPLPHHRDGHRSGDHRQVKHTAEEGAGNRVHLIDGGTHPQGESGDTRHRHHHDEQSVQEPPVEHGILEELDIVLLALRTP